MSSSLFLLPSSFFPLPSSFFLLYDIFANFVVFFTTGAKNLS